MKIRKYLPKLLLVLMLGVMMGSSGCHVYMNDFPRKKYKIRKHQPPYQCYYDKYDIFNPYKHKQRRKAKKLKKKQLQSRRIAPKKKAAHGQPFPKW